MKRISISLINWNKALAFTLLLFLFFCLVSGFLKNYDSGLIGHDEGVYIINAVGHYEDMPLELPHGNWLDAIEKGMARTADPPGSFFVIHFWETISMSERWLRLLPYMFFVSGIIALIRVGVALKIPLPLSIAVGFFPLASAQSVYHSVEIRGYQIELGLTYIALLLSLRLIQSIQVRELISKRNWLFLTVTMVFGMSTRWSFIITASAIYGALFCYCFIDIGTKNRKRTINVLVVSAVLAYMSFALFYLMVFGPEHGFRFFFLTDEARINVDMYDYFWPTNSIIERLFYNAQKLIATLTIYPGLFYREWEKVLLLIYCCVFLAMVYRILLHLTDTGISLVPGPARIHRSLFGLGWVLIIFAVFVNEITWAHLFEVDGNIESTERMIIRLASLTCVISGVVLTGVNMDRFWFNDKQGLFRLKNVLTKYFAVLFIPLIAFLISILLDCLGLHPYKPFSRVSLYLQGHYNFFLIGMICICCQTPLRKSGVLIRVNDRFIYPTFVILVLCFSIFHGVLFSRYEIDYRGGGQNIAEVIRQVVDEKKLIDIDYWYISNGAANNFRYHALYGNLRGKLSAEAEVVFEKFSNNNPTSDIDLQLQSIFEESTFGDEIILVTGHADRDLEKKLSILGKKTNFEIKKRLNRPTNRVVNRSSAWGQAYYIVMDN